MRLRSAAILGGGPGGLYVARLIRLRQPGCQVDVYEQSAPALTFGFGVGLATRTQRKLEAADPDSFRGIAARSWRHEISMAVGDATVRVTATGQLAIGRRTLLDVLGAQAVAAGARLHYGAHEWAEGLEADLVVAADGAGSPTRAAYARDFGTQIETHDGLYLWCGTDFALPCAVFCPAETECGTFVAHAYPYQQDRSTFLVETDTGTWRRAGFESATRCTSPGASDNASLAYLTKAFGDRLRGHPLLGNRTRWSRFRTVTCAAWHRGNVVLLGDAAHTAHYSIGSGTKLAMEDGIALVDALADAGNLDEALTRYESARRPAVEHLQSVARRSMLWWDAFPARLDLPAEQLLISYMTRAGKVSIDRFAAVAPDVVTIGLARYAGCPVSAVPAADRAAWVLSRPFTAAGRAWASRVITPGRAAGRERRVDLPDAWCPGANALLGAVRDGAEPGGVALLTSAGNRDAVLTMFDFAERLRREAGLTVAARVNRVHLPLAADALASARIDLVELAS